jgi:hypothetical protein
MCHLTPFEAQVLVERLRDETWPGPLASIPAMMEADVGHGCYQWGSVGLADDGAIHLLVNRVSCGRARAAILAYRSARDGLPVDLSVSVDGLIAAVQWLIKNGMATWPDLGVTEQEFQELFGPIPMAVPTSTTDQ